MHSFIELDGVTTPFANPVLHLEESDWFLVLARPEGGALELAGEVRGERLRLDLRALDAVLGALQGCAITTYPGGQSVCEAFLEVQREGETATLHADFPFDWDRHIDTPGRIYAEPRRLRMKFTVSWPEAS